MSTKTVAYPGKDIDVTWDGQLCIHIGECGRAKGELFQNGRQPWCQPDVSSTEEVIHIVERCPTGALSYNDKKTNKKETPASENTITVSYNGPLFIEGDINIQDIPEDMPGVKFRAALCRCGASKNKPFCDNEHEKINFKDYGAIGERGTPLNNTGGPLDINPIEDGPLVIKGNVTLLASSGRVAWQGEKVALCRCGASKNKPFCDGSHVEAGFKSD